MKDDQTFDCEQLLWEKQSKIELKVFDQFFNIFITEFGPTIFNVQIKWCEQISTS